MAAWALVAVCVIAAVAVAIAHPMHWERTVGLAVVVAVAAAVWALYQSRRNPAR